jgi:ornithine decarboxylase
MKLFKRADSRNNYQISIPPKIQEQAITSSAAYNGPVLMFDVDHAVNCVNEIRHQIGEVRYAVKAGPYPKLLKKLTEQGHGFDVASVTELYTVLEAGADTNKIVASNPALGLKASLEMVKAGVKYFVVDDINGINVHVELNKLGYRSSVLLRLDHSDESAMYDLASKFGGSPEEIESLLITATDLGVSVVGMAFHTGSQARDCKASVEALAAAIKIWSNAEKTPDSLILDIGGGFPAPYPGEPNWIDTTHALIEALKDFPGTIWCEPGRAAVADSGYLLSQIMSVAERKNVRWVHADVGAYHGLQEFSALVTKPLQVKVKSLTKSGGIQFYTKIAGPTCDSLDVLGSTFLPEQAPGDFLVFLNAGAYSLTMGCTFNGFSAPVLLEIAGY